ncbi:hypothetical protein V8F20_006591 [Naviculisporaceae sp. PSN 640]
MASQARYEGDVPESHRRSSHRVPRQSHSRPSGSRRSSQSVPDTRAPPRQESRQGRSRPPEQIAPPPHRLRQESRDTTSRTRTRAEEPEPQIPRGSRHAVPIPPAEEYLGPTPPPPYNRDPTSAERLPAVPPQSVSAVGEAAQPAPEAAELPVISGLQDVQSSDAIIAVLGMTGSGKTTFVSHFCATAQAGHALESATTQVEAHLSHHTLRGRRLIFVDTPGFDDTHRTDTEVLRDIVHWLHNAYERNIRLTGLVYLHGVNHPRVAGSVRTNMRHFRDLCGDESMTSVALATTHWSRDPRERSRQEQRHQELSNNDLFWKEMIRKGAQVFKHDNGIGSAWSVVNYLLDRNSTPGSGIYPQVIRELASGMTLDQTTIGAAFNRQIRELSENYENQINELRREMDEMRRQSQRDSRRIDQITEDREDLEAEIRYLQDKLREEKLYRRRLQVSAGDFRAEGDPKRTRWNGTSGGRHGRGREVREDKCAVM